MKKIYILSYYDELNKMFVRIADFESSEELSKTIQIRNSLDCLLQPGKVGVYSILTVLKTK